MKSALLGCAAVALLVGCSPSGGGGGHSSSGGSSGSGSCGATPAPVSQVVAGDAGVTLSAADGTYLRIPDQHGIGFTTITLTPALGAATPAGATEVGVPWLLGPAGDAFAFPFTVTLAFCPQQLPAGKTAADVVVLTGPPLSTSPVDSASFTSLGGTLIDSTHIQVTTSYFSIFVAAVFDYVPPATLSGPDAFHFNSVMVGTAGEFPWPDGGEDTSTYYVIMGQAKPTPIACYLDGGTSSSFNFSWLGNNLSIVVGTPGAPLPPGTYPFVLTPYDYSGLDVADAGALLELFDPAAQAVIAYATSGSVTLTEVAPVFTGSFSAALTATDAGLFGGTGDTLSGTFAAPVCPYSPPQP